MITWIQNNLQTHLKFLFILLLLVVIVAFVFTIGNIPGFGGPDRSIKRRDFYGYDLNSQIEMRELFYAAALSLEIDSGFAPRSGFQNEEAALRRAALGALADQLQIPEPDTEQLKSFIRSRNGFRDPASQEFSHERYASFIDRLKSEAPELAMLLPSVLKQDFRIQQVSEHLSGPGYVLPFELEKQYAINETLWSLEVGVLDRESFELTIEIEPDDKALEAYYAENQPNYSESEKVVVAYALFPSSDFRDQVELPNETELQEYFETHKAQYQKPPYLPPAPSDALEIADLKDKDAVVPELTLNDVRSEVMLAVVTQKASRRALRAADDFVYSLFDLSIKKDSQAFTNALEANNLEIQAFGPYSLEELPSAAEAPIPQALLLQAFDLNEQRYYSDPQATDDGAAVLFLKERIPPRQLSFDEARDQVIEDFLKEEKRRLFSEQGKTLYEQLTQSLKEGEQSFAEAAETHALTVENYSGFKLSTAPADLNRSLLTEVTSLQPGDLSPMITLSDKGYFLYVVKREAPTIDPESKEVQQALESQQAFMAMMTERSIITDLITHGLEASQRED